MYRGPVIFGHFNAETLQIVFVSFTLHWNICLELCFVSGTVLQLNIELKWSIYIEDSERLSTPHAAALCEKWVNK